MGHLRCQIGSSLTNLNLSVSSGSYCTSEIVGFRVMVTHFYTVRLLTHVHCKPRLFFLHSFIVTMLYCLRTSFTGVMKDWADKYHVWGTRHEVTFKAKLAIIQTHVFAH